MSEIDTRDCECERWRDGATVCPVHGTVKPEDVSHYRHLAESVVSAFGAEIIQKVAAQIRVTRAQHPSGATCECEAMDALGVLISEGCGMNTWDGLVNSGFWDLDPEERGWWREQAEEQHGQPFSDLTSEERAWWYERATEHRA